MSETVNQETPEAKSEMTFFEHLGELRGRIIKALIGLIIALIICLVFVNWLVNNILLYPAKNAHMDLQNLRPFGLLFMYFQVAMAAAVVLSLPNLFYQFWQFISPALREKEKKYLVTIVFFSTFCFLVGIVFAYFVMLPLTLTFVANFGADSIIKNQFAIDEYMDIIVSIMLACGVIFELPMISFFLSKIGILTPAFMRKYRRHAIVIIMFMAAILSPGTDPVSQIILAIPLVVLYEISIIVSKYSGRKKDVEPAS